MTNKERYEKLNKIIANGYPLKNDIFMIFAKNKDFCQEFLRVILQDDELEVIENDIQKVLPAVFNKNVVLDMLCRLKNKDTSNNIVFAKAKTKNQGNYHTGHLDNRLNRGALK